MTDRLVAVTRRSLVLGGGSAAALALFGYLGSSEPKADRQQAPDSAQPTEPAADAPRTTVATAIVDSLAVFDQPDDPDAEPAGAQTRVLETADEASGSIVLVVLDAGAQWLQVQLPVRPNGSTGWIRARDARLSTHQFAMAISLGGHELVVTNAGREVMRTPVGVGRSDRPTPGGDYFIKELLQPPEPDGVYGPYAYGLSGFSTVLTEFNGGEGVIGIHGTDEPGLVGQDVSSGCIRLPNDKITELVENIGLPLGTPVTITA